MRDLNDELVHFARAIICGEEPSSKINMRYLNYSGVVAVEVYRNNYRGNLHDALAGAYPVIKQLVGDDFFRFLARKFIGQYPSRSANLHRYGAELADFIASFAPAQKLVYLSDVASLEWACHMAYLAADSMPFALDKLALISPERYSDLILCVHPACRIVHSRYPIAAIWRAHQTGLESDFQINLEGEPCVALVSRVEGLVQVNELSADEEDWLVQIRAGVSLGTSVAATIERFPEFDLQAVLLRLVAQNVVIDTCE